MISSNFRVNLRLRTLHRHYSSWMTLIFHNPCALFNAFIPHQCFKCQPPILPCHEPILLPFWISTIKIRVHRMCLRFSIKLFIFNIFPVIKHYSLVTVDRPYVRHGAFRSIGADTLAQLLESMTPEQFNKRFMLIDCRYPYEFTGGHILVSQFPCYQHFSAPHAYIFLFHQYSENIFRAEDVIKLFYPDDEQQFQEVCQRIPIFYCEFSQKRGPTM